MAPVINASKDAARMGPDDGPGRDGTEESEAVETSSRPGTAATMGVQWMNPEEEEDERISVTPDIAAPPDGGWGWMVVAASFTAHLIADGCGFSFGILLSELLTVFGETTAKTAWIGSVFVSMPLICGPIASALTNKFGCRRTTIIGGVIASFGCITSSMVNSVNMICLTFGVISGFGLALVFIPAVLVVAFYFEKKRAFATGIAVAGTGIGTFVFAPLTEFLIAEYTWRGALLIIGALMLNFTVCGAMFRPLVEQIESTSTAEGRSSAVAADRTSCLSATQSIEDVPNGGTPQQTGMNCTGSGAAGTCTPADTSLVFQPRFVLKPQLCDGDCVHDPMTLSLMQLPTYLNEIDAIDERSALTTDNVAEMGHQLRLIHANCEFGRAIDELESVHRHADTAGGGCGERTGNARNSLAISSRAISTGTPALVFLSSDGCLAVGNTSIHNGAIGMGPLSLSMIHLNRHRRELFYRGGLLRAGFVLTSGRSTSCPDIYVHTHRKKRRRLRDRLASIKELLGNGLRAVSAEMFDVSIFHSAIFSYFCLHCMFFHLSFNVPYVYMPISAMRLGISGEMASTLVSVIGISSTIGQVVMGYLNDHPRVNTLHFYIVMTSGAGLCTIVAPFLTSFPLLAVYCAFYGLCISANYVLTTVILVELLGMDKLTNAFGFVSSAGGIALLVGSPLAGWISDSTNRQDVMFYLFGAIMLVSGVMLLLVPCIGRCDKDKSSHIAASTPVVEPPTSLCCSLAAIDHHCSNGVGIHCP